MHIGLESLPRQFYSMTFSVHIREVLSRPITEQAGHLSATYALLISLLSFCTRPDRKLQNIFFCSVFFLGAAVQKFWYFCEPLESVWERSKQKQTNKNKIIQDLLYSYLVSLQDVFLKCQTGIPSCIGPFLKKRNRSLYDGSKLF